jgi:hypothetical protein
LWSAGTVVLTIGVALIHAGREGADPIAAVGSFILVAAMLVFAVFVFRPAAADRNRASLVLTPAE